MIDADLEVRLLPVASIEILNPRERDRAVFDELIESIRKLGLKKPITVSECSDRDGYRLVCGQGRLEAFIALGQEHIPAITVRAEVDDCFVMSLVENCARRNPSALEMLAEVGALKQRGYSASEIARKIAFTPDHVQAICYLLEHGEERLLDGIHRGVIPVSVALQIARARDSDVRSALIEAYEDKSLPGNKLTAIRRIVELRNVKGKALAPAAPTNRIRRGDRPY